MGRQRDRNRMNAVMASAREREEARCARCPNQHDGWPVAGGDGELCQDCWEAQCSEAWWEAMDAALGGQVEERGEAVRHG